MTIYYHEGSKTFHLTNDQISYIFTVLQNDQLGQVYFGAKIHDRESFDHLVEIKDYPMAAYNFESNRSFSLEHLKQEYPTYGAGDMRYGAFTIQQNNGSRIANFVYESHRVYAGKPKLPGLPATYVEDEQEAETLEVTLIDQLTDTVLILRYTLFANLPVITRNVRFEQHGKEKIYLDRALSLNLDLPDRDYEMVQLTGAWSRERHLGIRSLEYGVQSIYSLRGSSSANFNPFLALKRPEATEDSGEVIGFSLVYSGNFLGQVEVDTYDVARVSLGINPEEFKWPLETGEMFETPEAVMVYSQTGLNGMSHTFHELYQKRLARGHWRDKERPILINNWEATYFDFNEDKILDIAQAAQKSGIELFVLDDGWFGTRNDDSTSLGDWFVNVAKLPDGLSGLGNKIEALGMKFGIWIEPEMVNKKSQLYQKHPDWVLQTPGRAMSQGRNQYVLDFSRPEVVENIFEQLKAAFTDAPISYVKWDMNRSITEAFSAQFVADEQGKVMHQYILGVYSLYEKLIAEYPEILFESCASGGSRFDPGMLYYAPQAWTSDDTDAIERLKIQYGTSLVYPISSMGAHVSAIPNHQLLRLTPIETRANVAFFGAFGYELDLTKLASEEIQKVRQQVAYMKKHRKLLQFGTFYRLKSPFEGNVTAWMVVSSDQKQALVGYYRVLQQVNDSYHRIKLQGLNPDFEYQVSLIDEKIYGDELLHVGLTVSDQSSGENHDHYNGANGDFQSRIYELTVS
ncbi:alpha-galactosidase [Enterococcus sp. CSURQ0835]|uniref:alpha-galactosidase n=1 Tax=Enterococcus sp. CSURQ0835 TaxID=2681394 RepID=UPI00135C606A|nr:alpha-galactosidase [Enterococcus sp. CSURQ0835]